MSWVIPSKTIDLEKYCQWMPKPLCKSLEEQQNYYGVSWYSTNYLLTANE